MKGLTRISLLMIMLSLLFSYNLCAKEQKIKGQAKVNLRSANLYLVEKKEDKALGFYLKVLEEYPDNVTALSNVGAIYFNKAEENVDEAKDNLLKANTYYKKMLDVINSMPDYKEYDNFDKLKDNAEKIVKNIWLRFFKMGQNYFYETEAGSLDKAEKEFLDLSALSPDSVNVYLMLAAIYEKKENKAKQTEYFNLILQKDPNNLQVLDNLANDYYQAQNFEKSAEYYVKLTSIKADKADYYLFAAYSYYNLKNNEKTLEYFEKTLTVDPNNVDAIANCATIAQQNNQNDKATNYLKKLIEVEDTEENISILCYHLAKIENWKELLPYAQKWNLKNPEKKEAVQMLWLVANKLKNKELEIKYTNMLKKM